MRILRGVTDPAGTNNGLFERAKWIAKSNSLDLQGPIFHDLCDMDRYLLNQVDVKIKFYKNPASFALLAVDNTTDFRVVIQDIYIIARKVKVNPAVIYGHTQILEKQMHFIRTRKKKFESKLSLLEAVHLGQHVSRKATTNSHHRVRQE